MKNKVKKIISKVVKFSESHSNSKSTWRMYKPEDPRLMSKSKNKN